MSRSEDLIDLLTFVWGEKNGLKAREIRITRQEPRGFPDCDWRVKYQEVVSVNGSDSGLL